MATKRHLLIALLCVAMLPGAAVAVEEPAYQTVQREGNFEVREYPALVAAEVTVAGDQKEAGNRGFRLLASYIFGDNRRREGIAMTAPVTQRGASEKIAMTAPVAQVQDAPGSWVVRFTMPSGYSLETLPVPDDSRVRLKNVEAVRVAVLRFSGLAQADDVEAKSRELLALAKSHSLRVAGPVSLAQYNPPWTLWFMRRNEVMVPVER